MRFGLSVTVSDARASHLLHWAVVYRFDFRFWFGRLCFAFCFIWQLFCSLLCHIRLDRVSGFMSLEVGMVYLKAAVVGTWVVVLTGGCVVWLSVNVSDACASHFALFGGCLCHL